MSTSVWVHNHLYRSVSSVGGNSLLSHAIASIVLSRTGLSYYRHVDAKQPISTLETTMSSSGLKDRQRRRRSRKPSSSSRRKYVITITLVTFTSSLSLSLKYHPDSNSADKSLHEKFVKINQAFSTLSKQASRVTYDQCKTRSPSSTHHVKRYHS